MARPPDADPDLPETPATADGEPEVLEITARGTAVKRLQRMLRDAGHSLKEDGLFGQATLAAVKAFQAANGLKRTGSPARGAALTRKAAA